MDTHSGYAFFAENNINQPNHIMRINLTDFTFVDELLLPVIHLSFVIFTFRIEFYQQNYYWRSS